MPPLGPHAPCDSLIPPSAEDTHRPLRPPMADGKPRPSIAPWLARLACCRPRPCCHRSRPVPHRPHSARRQRNWALIARWTLAPLNGGAEPARLGRRWGGVRPETGWGRPSGPGSAFAAPAPFPCRGTGAPPVLGRWAAALPGARPPIPLGQGIGAVRRALLATRGAGDRDAAERGYRLDAGRGPARWTLAPLNGGAEPERLGRRWGGVRPEAGWGRLSGRGLRVRYARPQPLSGSGAPPGRWAAAASVPTRNMAPSTVVRSLVDWLPLRW